MKNARQQMIIELLKQDGLVSTSDLTGRFGVSVETIRRDFKQLEKAGILKPAYGGAVPLSGTLRITELDAWQDRAASFRQEKSWIARKAAEYVPDGSVLATDVGTTMFELARHLNQKSNLTIITNDLRLAQELRQDCHQVYLAGGLLNTSLYTSGELCREFVDHFALIDLFIFSADGITLEDGLTTIRPEENELKKRLIQKAEKKIAVVDHSKFGKKALLHTCRFDQIDLLITDSRAPDGLVQAIRKFTNVDVVSPDSDAVAG